MTVRPAEHETVTVLEDSRRWAHIDRRPDDIVISTPPKSGTTWMQGIVTALLWPDDDAPGAFSELSPWVDARLPPIAEVAARVEAQPHRRFFKTHTSAGALPIDTEGKYIVVYRDGRDALISWSNHRSVMRPEIVRMLNDEAANDGVDPWPLVWSGDMDELFDEWAGPCSPTRHLAGWWPSRDEPFVLFVHYADLTADLEGEMRRIAAFLDLDVAEDRWPAVVDRCLLDSMRTEAAEAGGHDIVFEGGAEAFFHQGGSGRWEGVLTDEQLARYADMVAELPAEAAAWLEHGSVALGRRP
jgi:aryl sulfotransferase